MKRARHITPYILMFRWHMIRIHLNRIRITSIAVHSVLHVVPLITDTRSAEITSGFSCRKAETSRSSCGSEFEAKTSMNAVCTESGSKPGGTNVCMYTTPWASRVQAQRRCIPGGCFQLFGIHTHTHMHTCTHAHMHTCTHAHMHTHTHTHTDTCLRVYKKLVVGQLKWGR